MGFARVNFVMATLLAAMLANAASDVSDVMPPEYDALNVVTGASRMLAGAAPDNNNPPKFAAGTSPTALEKRLQVQSEHTISSDVIKNSNTQRSVNVADSKNVRITQPRLTVSMAGDANTHMSLTDTDALDVSDDESFDLVGTGNAKVIAGEMDDVASVFPGGTITRAQATGTEGTGASSIPPTIPPSTLSNDFRVTASFKVPSRIGSAVNVREETTVRGGESVHIDGINVDVKSGTSHNKQIVANDADLADIADNGGTTGMATGNAIVVTGEVEEPMRGANGPHSSTTAQAVATPSTGTAEQPDEARRRTLKASYDAVERRVSRQSRLEEQLLQAAQQRGSRLPRRLANHNLAMDV